MAMAMMIIMMTTLKTGEYSQGEEKGENDLGYGSFKDSNRCDVT